MTAADVPTIALWLRAHIGEISRCDWAAEMLDEITAANGQMTRLIDSPPSKVYAGRCEGTGRINALGVPADPSPDANDYIEPCGSDLHVREDDRHHLATVRCGVCGSTYSLAMRQEWVRLQYRGKLVTVADGAVLHGIKKDTIKSWIRRKKIRRAFTGDERNVYLVDDLLELDRGRKISDAA